MLARAAAVRCAARSILSRSKPAASPFLPRRGLGWRQKSSVHAQLRDRSIYLSKSASDAGRAEGVSPGNLWFRDNCHCSSCVNPTTLQRNIDTFEIPENITVNKLNRGSNGLEIEWSDGHVSFHPWAVLELALPNADWPIPKDGQIPWDSTIAKQPPEVSFGDVMDNTDSSGMAKLTNDIHMHGLCFVKDTPITPEATEKLLEKIGPIRNTHYGGFYDFIPDQAMADTAYTNIALAAHTDATYFSEPARLQAFHMLSHHKPPTDEPEDGNLGGQSLLVDGFKVAEDLLSQDATSYAQLREFSVPWHASGNDGISISPYKTFPVIEQLYRDGTHATKRIRWNTNDRGVLQGTTAPTWYEAARKFDSLVKSPRNEFWFQLQPGSVLIFDNWRVLHGRSAFLGMRRICGGYISHDDFFSRWKMTNFSREVAIMDSLIDRIGGGAGSE